MPQKKVIAVGAQGVGAVCAILDDRSGSIAARAITRATLQKFVRIAMDRLRLSARSQKRNPRLRMRHN